MAGTRGPGLQQGALASARARFGRVRRLLEGPARAIPGTRCARLFLAAWALLVAGPACDGLPRDGGPPSIVLVTLDTLRADHLGAYGYFRSTSPTLDRFARSAVLFEKAYAPMATTLPAHVSLMTGTNTLRHGLKGNVKHLGEPFDAATGLRTLAQMLQEEGYRTAAFVSATPLKRYSGIQAGFEHFDQPDAEERRAAATTDRALAWLEGERDGPFLLWVHYFDPHAPWEPPGPYARAFRTTPRLAAFLRSLSVPPRRAARVNNLYDGEILYMDRQIGRLFRSLRELGHWERAAIVVAGDHGEGLGQHGWMGHGRIYNEQIRVPLMLRLPAGRGPRGVRSERLASLVDLLPTLSATLALPLRESDRAQLQGVNLLGGGTEREPLFVERVHRERGWGPGLKYALVGGRWKYFHRTEGPDELYDLLEDPTETRNVIEAHPERAAELRARLLARLAHEDRPPRPGEGEPLPPRVREELRALGYLE